MRFPNLLGVLVFMAMAALGAGAVVLLLRRRWLGFCDRLHVPEGHLLRRRLWAALVTLSLILGVGASSFVIMALQGMGGDPILSTGTRFKLDGFEKHPALARLGQIHSLQVNEWGGQDGLFGRRRTRDLEARLGAVNGEAVLKVHCVKDGWTAAWKVETAFLTPEGGARIDLTKPEAGP